MLYPELEEKLHWGRHALNRANSENIIELCKQYLTLLAEYRNRLYDFQGTAVLQRQSLLSVTVPNTTKAIRAAIENTTQERNRTETLLLSFTTVTGYQAVEIFNRREYEGHRDWELRASGVRPGGNSGRDLMTIQQAVDVAGLLRREEYISQNAGSDLFPSLWED